MRWAAATAMLSAVGLALGQPALTAKAAVAIDSETGRVLYASNADIPLPPASTTKILTALVVLEEAGLDDVVAVPATAEGIEGSSMHLKAGETITVRDLLYGLMLRSGNDAAHTLALHVAGSVEAFAAKMEAKARSLGCGASRFLNPHGLPEPGHVASAHDLARLGAAAMLDPEFAAIVATPRRVVARGAGATDTLIRNRNRWLAASPIARGIKTGRTVEAGQCFVGCAEKPEGKVVTALLGSSDWLADQDALVAWCYAGFQRRTLVPAGERLGAAKVSDGAAEEVAYGIAEPVVAMARADEPAPEPLGSLSAAAPVAKGDRLGTVAFRASDGTVFHAEAVALEDVGLSFWARWGSMMVWGVAAAATGLAALGALRWRAGRR
jgi:D-alanyl-D-alanine carboxypeptidase (penicillin-binding protein 5/6)